MKLPRTVTKHAAVAGVAVTALVAVRWPREFFASVALIVFAVVVFKVRRWQHNRRRARRSYPQTAGPRRWYVYVLVALDALTGAPLKLKVGYTGRTPEIRCAEVQEDMGPTVDVRVVAFEEYETKAEATGREDELHVMFDRYRYPRSEWFQPVRQVWEVAAAMPRRTVLGQRLLRDVA